MQAHIYLVTNSINEQKYVGQTIVNKNRIGHGLAINHAYKKHGKRNFTYKVLVSNIDNKNTLNYLERFWIKAFNTKTPNGYNIEQGGSGHSNHRKGLPAWNKGLRTPKEVVLKLSLAKNFSLSWPNILLLLPQLVLYGHNFFKMYQFQPLFPLLSSFQYI